MTTPDVTKKLDSMTDKLEAMGNTLIRIEENLREHMRRTALNEEAIALLAREMMPVKNEMAQARAVARALGYTIAGLATLVGLIASILKILEYFK